MNLSDAQRKYLVREQIVGGALVNGVINAFLGWLTFRHHSVVPMHGDPSILNDVIATSVLMPLFICVIATPLVHKALQSGKARALDADAPSAVRTMILWLPANSFLRGALLAAAALATCTPLLLGTLLLCGVHGMSVAGFATLKFFYAGTLAGLVSPIVALYAMAAPRPLKAAVLSESEA
jgi:hypothetical protein